MTIYNLHPNDGSFGHIEGVLKTHLRLTNRQAKDVINDIKELYSNNDIRAIRKLADDINYRLPYPMVYYKYVDHWNRGTTRTSSRR